MLKVNICLGFVFHDEHGGAFHPAHAHDHAHGGEEHHKHETRHDAGSAASYQKVPATDEEQGGGSHGHGHNHGHSSGGCSSTAEKSHEGETTHLLASGASSYGGAGTEHRHDHDHSAHAHAHDEESAQHSSHDHSHAHSSHGHKRHVDIDSSPHTGHDHSHGHKHHTSDVNIEACLPARADGSDPEHWRGDRWAGAVVLPVLADHRPDLHAHLLIYRSALHYPTHAKGLPDPL